MTEPDRDVLGRALDDLEAPTKARVTGAVPLLYLERLVRRQWLVIAAAMLIGGASAYLWSISRPTQYEASARLLFRASDTETALFGRQRVDEVRASLTNVELGSLDVVARATERRLAGSGLDAQEVAEQVDVTAGQGSDLAVARATAGTASLAARLANAYATEYIALRRRTDRARVLSTRARVTAQLRQLPPRRRRGEEGRLLRDRVAELGVLLALRDGNVQLVERAVAPQARFAPRPRRSGIVGLIAGLLAGLMIAAIREHAGRRIRREDDLEKNLDLPVLARIPQSRALDRLPDIDGPRGEAFRTLRAAVRTIQGERPHRSVAVCSSEPGEGKTLVSWGFALAEAHAGGRVLLVETDLRLPALSDRLAIGQPAGLTQLLHGESSREESIVTVASTGHRLDVLPAGTPSGDAAELLESDAMARLLAELEADYDMVVLDTAPFMVVADAMPLLAQVGGVVIVTRVGVTSIELVSEVRRRLTRGRARILGVVLNGTQEDLPDAGPATRPRTGRRLLTRA